MVNFLLSVPESTMQRLLDAACAQNISVDDHIRRVLSVGTAKQSEQGSEAITREEALELALDRAKAKGAGERFKLEDLFSPSEWARIPSPTVFGRQFRKALEAAQLARYVDRTAKNQAIYERQG